MGNMTERADKRATAASYVISPAAMAAGGGLDPDRSPDQLSALWLLALAARLVDEVGQLIARSLARPASAGQLRDRLRDPLRLGRRPAAFAAELANAVEGLVSRYHDESAPGGRAHRFVVALHPRITRPAAAHDHPAPAAGEPTTPKES